LGKQGYKCNVCKFPCHTRCLKKMPKDCMVVLPDGETIDQDTGERKRTFTKEDRGKTLPSLLKHKRKNSICSAPPEIQHVARTQRMKELAQWLERALDSRNYKTADKFNAAINRVGVGLC
jgi:Phorbol esters/diacylglycerol binding domain (C1 domain)